MTTLRSLLLLAPALSLSLVQCSGPDTPPLVKAQDDLEFLGASRGKNGGAGEVRPIDLPSALRLAGGQNLEIALFAEKANAAAARHESSKLSILPDLAVGTSFAKQNGLLQNTDGSVTDVERVASFSGLGTGALGAGGNPVPGVALDIDLGRAIYGPLASRQDKQAAEAAYRANRNRVYADVASAYYELLRAKAALLVAKEVESAAASLAKATTNFHQAGEGFESDAETASATHLLRQRQSAQMAHQFRLRSARLSTLLHLPAGTSLIPTEDSVALLSLLDASRPEGELVALALTQRPESAQYRAEVNAAIQRLREAKTGPFLPHLGAGYSTGTFDAGAGNSPDRDASREEFSAMIYWKLESLGFGNSARVKERKAEMNQAQLQRARGLDTIIEEVATARSDVHSLKEQITLARQAADHARRAYQLTASRLHENQGLPIEALKSIEVLATAREAAVDSVIDYNIAQYRLFTAVGSPTR